MSEAIGVLNWEHAPQIEAVLPNCDSPIKLPKGWTRADDAEPLTLICPEGDLRCRLIVLPLTGNAEETSGIAWRQVDPSFELPLFAKGEVPSTEGWDIVSQVVYSTPASDSRTVFTIVRTLGTLAYMILVDGSKAATGRRMAQVSELLELWKPAGLKSINLAARRQPAWGVEQSRALSDFIRDGMDKCLIPGLSIAVVQSGKVVFAEGFGVGELGRPERVTPATRFMIGSSTKPLTTLMMAHMIDQGAFTWSTPVTDLLPNFKLADPEVTRKLQMRHTVCACTGMPRRDADFLFRFEGITPEQRLESMQEMRPTTGFGETFQYSNLLVAVGGYAAAKVFAPELPLADAYDAAMKTLVFEPLNMANSFLNRQEACTCGYAYPHGLDFDQRCVPIDLTIEGTVESVAPAGGAWSTVEDMARYLLLELNGGVTSDGHRLLSEDTLRSRWSGAIKINEKMGYGLGLLYMDEQGLHVMTHGGNTLGFTSDFFFLPEQNLGVVVLTNRRVANAFLGAVKQRIFEILFGAEPKAGEMVAAIMKTRDDSAARARERIKTDAASVGWISEFVGSYSSPELGSATVTRTGDEFQIQFESWGSSLGAEIQPDGARLIALTSAPWSGSFRFQTLPQTGDIVLDAGQEKYTFHRQQSG